MRMARAPLLAALVLLVCSAGVMPGQHRVAPGHGLLQQALAQAAGGDTLVLEAGEHQGPVVIDKPLHITGLPGARLLGAGKGRVVTIAAPGATLSGLYISGSGLDLSTEDAGVYVTAKGVGAVVEDNQLNNNLIGVYLKGSRDAIVRGNSIMGRQDLRMNERGNGVQIWNAPGAVVENNTIRHGRDGIFVTTSRNNRFHGNRFSHLRFGVHYMYTNDSEVSANVSTGNHSGFAIMFSQHLQIIGNTSEGDRDRGLLFNYANDSLIRANRVRPGPEKCVFLYNSNRNELSGNQFQGCEIGIHFTAGSEGNAIAGNAFLSNRTQVKYVGTRYIEWSHEGRGNYWSDNSDFDLNGDGIADRPYRPNDLVDHVVWRHPLARLLLSSPAMHVLAAAQSQFPGLHPGGVVDSAPLMRAPAIATSSELTQ